jgi:hypothetical protein
VPLDHGLFRRALACGNDGVLDRGPTRSIVRSDPRVILAELGCRNRGSSGPAFRFAPHRTQQPQSSAPTGPVPAASEGTQLASSDAALPRHPNGQTGPHFSCRVDVRACRSARANLTGGNPSPKPTDRNWRKSKLGEPIACVAAPAGVMRAFRVPCCAGCCAERLQGESGSRSVISPRA